MRWLIEKHFTLIYKKLIVKTKYSCGTFTHSSPNSFFFIISITYLCDDSIKITRMYVPIYVP